MNTEIKEIEAIIQYKFHSKALIQTAVTHSSYANEHGLESNERLEFLGDTVLNFVISEQLFRQVNKNEGSLSKMRAKVVSEDPLSMICDNLGLDKYIRRGAGERKNIATKAMRADLIEAIIGAIYLDSNINCVKKFINRNFNTLLQQTETAKIIEDSKTYIQEKFGKDNVKYKTIKSGEEHQPVFESKIFINGQVCGVGIAGNKRSAEQLAASDAIKNIKQV